MNKDLTNLILSYFTIDFNTFINHIKIANPIVFIIHNISNSIIYSLFENNYNNIYYRWVINYYVNSHLSNGGVYLESGNNNDARVGSIVTGVNEFKDYGFMAPDLLTSFYIFNKKYNVRLAKLIILAKLADMIKPVYKYPVGNLIDSYRLLLTESKTLNLEGPIPMYDIEATFSDSNAIVISYIPPYVTNVDSYKTNIYKTLNDIDTIIPELYNKILIAINKF